MSKSQDYFRSNLTDAFAKFQTSLNDLVKVIARDSKDQKLGELRKLDETIKRLKLLIHVGELPTWVNGLSSVVKNTMDSYDPATLDALSVFLSTNYQGMMRQTWKYLDDDSEGLQIDVIVQQHYDRSQVSSGFDDLVKQLVGVIESGEIDSVRGIKSLKGLIALIRKNQKKATTSLWIIHATRHFFWHYLEQLSTEEKASPYLRSIVPAIKKTIESTEESIISTFNESESELRERLKAEVPLLGSTSVSPESLHYLLYDPKTLSSEATPTPNTQQLLKGPPLLNGPE